MEDKEGSPFFLTQKRHTLILTNVALVNLLKHKKIALKIRKLCVCLCVFVCVCVRKFVQKRT